MTTTVAAVDFERQIKLKGFHPEHNPGGDYQDAKRPIRGATWTPVNGDGEAWEQAGGWIGGVVPEGLIFCDIDDRQTADFLHSVLKKAGASYYMMNTQRGRQLAFADNRKVDGQKSHFITAGGFVCDYRLQGKGYTVLTGRTIERIKPERELSPMPSIFLPLKRYDKAKDADKLLPLPITEGQRDDVLFGHLCRIRSLAAITGVDVDLERLGLEVNGLFCEPSLPHHQVVQKVRSAERYEKPNGREQEHEEIDPRPLLITVADVYAAKAEAPPAIIQDFLIEKTVNVISGPSGCLKTFLAHHLSDCVTENKSFLGMPTRKRPVTIIDRENPASVLTSYFDLLGIERTSEITLWPSWARTDAPSFPNNAYLDIASNGGLIIFDSLIRFYPRGTDENVSTHIAPLMDFLRRLTKEGATVIVLHHAGKAEGSEYRGSSDIKGGADVLWTVKRDDEKLRLKCVKSRFYAEREIHLQVISDDTSLRFEVLGGPGSQELELMAGLLTEDMTYSAFFEKVKAELYMGKSRFERLTNQGLGAFWSRRKEGRLTIFSPKSAVWSVSPPYKAADYGLNPSEQTNEHRTKEVSADPQTLDSKGWSDSPGGDRTKRTKEVFGDVAEVMD
jgi:hypothetical protein